MTKNLLLATSVMAILSASLTGCETISDKRQEFLSREISITNVVGSIWRIEAKWPGEANSIRLQEFVMQRATQFCDNKGKGMLPLNASFLDASDSTPTQGWMEFRCERPHKAPDVPEQKREGFKIFG